MITGFWATCNNVGNIFGLQTAAVILNYSDDAWEYLMIMVFLMYLALAALIFRFFVADPKQVGLEIAEIETGNFELQTMDAKESKIISPPV
jgi:sugar phosphate permease